MMYLSASARAFIRGFRLAAYAAFVSLLATFFSPAQAEDINYQRIQTLQVPGNPLASFDISWVDPVREIYLLADRSNNSLDVFDTNTKEFLFQAKGFVGVGPTSDTSGPNGVVTAERREAWAGDGDSTVKVVDLRTHAVIDTIPTGGTKRADELSFDPRDHMILIANDADDPPFVTIISTKPGHAILKKISFPEATNGIEQSQWSRTTGLFYQAIPEINGNVGHGEIAVIDPKSLSVVATLPVDCEPAGLTLGPDQQALIGCSQSGTDNAARVMDLRNGKILATFPQITSSDEVWFNPGNNLYFVAASNNPASNGGPLLGIIDADTNTFVQTIPTGTGNHSVAAEPDLNHVFVPFRAVPTDPQCQNGCIVVFGPQDDQTASGNQNANGNANGNQNMGGDQQAQQ